MVSSRSEQRRGANGGLTRLRPDWFEAAAAAGIQFIRLRVDELTPSGRDFLIGAESSGRRPEHPRSDFRRYFACAPAAMSL